MLKKGFTFVELMIVIVIIAVLAGMVTGNFFSSLKKGRDARRKEDLAQIQRAIELYYEDKKVYPSSLTFNSSLTDSVSGKIYMQKLPNDPISTNAYRYDSDGSYYRLFACIENTQDTGAGVSQSGFSNAGTVSCTGCTTCRYTITSTNISPLPTP